MRSFPTMSGTTEIAFAISVDVFGHFNVQNGVFSEYFGVAEISGDLPEGQTPQTAKS